MKPVAGTWKPVGEVFASPMQNAEHGYAWPSLTYIATQLKMHKSTVIRSLRILRTRGWITITHCGGRHRTNQYRIGFGRMEGDDAPS